MNFRKNSNRSLTLSPLSLGKLYCTFVMINVVIYICEVVWWPDSIGIQKCLLQSVSCFDFSHSLRKFIRFGSAILTLRCDVPQCPPRKRGGNNLDLLPPIWNENYCLLFTFHSLSRTFGLVLKQLSKFQRELDLEVWLRQIHDHNSINALPLPINFAKQK